MLKAILTFDLEFWYNSQFLKKYLPKQKSYFEDYIEESIRPILDLLSQYNQKATFFVLGQVAEKYPSTIKRIFALGHEIASHGYSHKPLTELRPKEFEEEITKTNQIIKKIIGQRPIGFRAPNFSLNHKTKWALKILAKYNFQYDSSISPWSISRISNPLIVEISPSWGGIYFRIIPLKLYLTLVKYTSKTKLPIFYFHPYELFSSAPRIESAPWPKRKIKYARTKNALAKFEELLKKINFISIEKYLNENSLN